MRTNGVCARACFCCLLLLAPAARGGNDDAYFLSNEAAMTGGAVVAVTQETGSVWYNPAGLGGIERDQLSLTMTAAALQIREIDGALTKIDPEGASSSEDMSGTRGGVVSPSAAAVLRVFGAPIGLGFFTTRYDVLDVTGGSAFDSERSGNAAEKITLDQIDVQYHVGAGTGFAVTPTLRVGASIFAVYTSVDDAATLAAGSDDEAGRVAVTAQIRDRSSRWGVQVVAGAQYDLPPVGTFGLAIRAPTLMLYEDPNVASFVSYSVSGTSDDFAVVSFPASRSAAKRGISSPATFVLGFAHRLPRLQLSVGADYSAPLESLSVDEEGSSRYLVERRSVINARLGGILSITDTLGLGVGLFTDRSPEKTPEDLGEFQVDYYGATLGIRFDERVKLAPGARAPDVVFRTVFSLRYALGIGETRGVVLDLQGLSPNSSNVPVENGELIDVSFHELYAYLGTAVDY